MRRFFSEEPLKADSRIGLGIDESRHIRDVLRLAAGDEIMLFDGSGMDFKGRIKSVAKRETVVDIISELEPASAESPLRLWLAVALLKSDKFDLVVQKAVELGVSGLFPIVTRRTDIKLKGSDSRVGRWRKIALEATKQCGRSRLMTVAEPIGLESVCEKFDDFGTVLFFSERGGGSIGDQTVGSVLAISGPEGGWDDSEIAAAKAKGARVVTLGGRILRAETAAIAIAAIIGNRFGDIN